MGSNLTFPICWVATAETRTGRRAAARARISLDPRRPEAEEPATAVCCVREEGANIFFSRSSAARELPRSGRVARVPSGARTLVRSCGVARWCSARGFVEQRMRCEWLEANRRGVLEGRTFSNQGTERSATRWIGLSIQFCSTVGTRLQTIHLGANWLYHANCVRIPYGIQLAFFYFGTHVGAKSPSGRIARSPPVPRRPSCRVFPSASATGPLQG